MTEPRQRIIEAAIGIFSRYGIRRTTMADIANAIGISRQTLYASFSGKDELVTATIRAVAEEKLARIAAAWEGLSGIEEKLDVYLDLSVHAYFDQLRAMPDYQDLLTGLTVEGQEAHRAAATAKREMLERLLAPCADRLVAKGCSPQQLADMFQRCSEGLIYSADSLDNLRQLTDSLKKSILSLALDQAADISQCST